MAPDPHKVAQALRAAATVLDDDGTLMLSRTEAWTPIDPPPSSHHPEPGRDDEDDEAVREMNHGTPADDDRRDAVKAGHYYREIVDLLELLQAKAARIQQLRPVVVPTRPKSLTTSDLQLAQLVVDGWCGSCARDTNHAGEPHLAPVAAGRFADRCRFCGDWRTEHRQDPPLPLLRAKHKADREGKRLSTKVVDAALGRTA